MAYDGIKQLSSVRPTDPVGVRPRHVKKGPKKKKQGQGRRGHRENDKDRLTLQGSQEISSATNHIDTQSPPRPETSRKKIDIRV